MNYAKALWPTLLLLWTSFVLTAQKAPMKFGKIDPSELSLTDCDFEPGAAALVLCDYGEGEFEIQGDNGFVFVLTRHKRIKLFNKAGLDQANISLEFFAGKSGDFEKIRNIKAACYSMENGAVKTTELSSKEIFTTDIGHSEKEIKFAIPGAREGCVIEYSYEMSSRDIAGLQDWFFQEDIPVLHSEYRLFVPDFFTFQKVLRGSLGLTINKENSSMVTYLGKVSGSDNRTRDININALTYQYQWAMDKVPALRREPFTAAMRDFAAHMETQLLSYQFQGGEAHEVMPSYEKFNRRLVESDDFGKAAKPGSFEKQLAGELAGSLPDPAQKAGAILKHIQEKVKWNGGHSIYCDQPTAKIYANGSGDAGDINLLLVACLRAAGLQADPVILGTRGYGLPHPVYPKSSKFNYVLAAIDIDGKTLLADATSRDLPLGFVAQKCLHGEGWRVSEVSPGWIPLQNNASGNQTTLVQVARSGDSWTGKATFKSTGYAATEVLQKVNNDGKDAYFKYLLQPLTDWNPGEPQFSRSDGPLSTIAEIPVSRDAEDGDVLYFKPVFAGGIQDNPLVAENRTWPLDFPFVTNSNYVLTLTVPPGFSVAEMPTDAMMTFGEKKDLVFQYRCSLEADQLTVISKLQMKRLFFMPDEYAELRQFYSLIVQKNQEMVVLKKT